MKILLYCFVENLSSHYVSAVPMSASEDQSVLHNVEPDHVPGLTPVESVPRSTAVATVYTDDDVDEGYVENRVITPTVHRQRPREQNAMMKEFGTQTGMGNERRYVKRKGLLS